MREISSQRDASRRVLIFGLGEAVGAVKAREPKSASEDVEDGLLEVVELTRRRWW